MTIVSAITDNIKISVINAFQPDFSFQGQKQYFFSYTIRIENQSKDKVQLISRFWHIKDALGLHRIVEGEGVVGEQPIILPGKSHEYSSACDFETAIGNMSGYYLFKRYFQGDYSFFRAAIPEFTLEAPFQLS